MTTRFASILCALALAATLPARAGDGAYRDETCIGHEPARFAHAAGRTDPDGDVRVYAIQYKQEIRYAATYETFRSKMRCLVSELVMPTADPDADGVANQTTIVVFNEDAGLATIATGSRGLPARALAVAGPKDPQNIPGALSAFAALAPGYAPAIAHYAARAPETSPQRLILSAATDTFVRGFMRTFSDIARDFGVYVVSSNNQAEFRETSDPATVAALHDPDLAQRYAFGELTTVFEAVDAPAGPGEGRAGIDVYNQAWMWAPADAPEGNAARARFELFNGGGLSATDPRRNVIHVTRKTPLTSIEREVLDLSDDGDMGEANTGPFTLLPEDDPEQRIKIGYGISLPSFMWGSDFGQPFDGDDPCRSSLTWMRCLDARGMNLFLQPEANPGMWGDYIDGSWSPPAFQALSWLDSAWRAVADPTVANIRYAVTPHMVGNLVDLTFDGQSAIFERCLPADAGDTCDTNTPDTFVGARGFLPCGTAAGRCDDPLLQPYAGVLREAMILAPWVMDDPRSGDLAADREALALRARAMQAGTGSTFENDYLETAIFADLDFD